jgi:hypothetical protein
MILLSFLSFITGLGGLSWVQLAAIVDRIPDAKTKMEERTVEFEMAVVLGLALIFFVGIIYLIVRERKTDTSQTAENPLWQQDSSQPANREKTR